MNEKHEITICLRKLETMPGVVECLSTLGSRNIILWYIGCYGLKKSCVEFYKKEIILPVLKNSLVTTFWLVDLTAWFGLKDVRGSIKTDSSLSCDIEKMGSVYFEVIRSSETFRNISEFAQKLTLENLISSMNSIVSAKPHKNERRTGILLEDLFPGDVPLLNPFKKQDSGEFYAALQYIEGLFIVQKILDHLFSANKDFAQENLSIQFVLPEDEYKYYLCSNASFETDLYLIVVNFCKLIGIEKISLNIEFLSFPFRKNKSRRPYNGVENDKTIKNLALEELSGLPLFLEVG